METMKALIFNCNGAIVVFSPGDTGIPVSILKPNSVIQKGVSYITVGILEDLMKKDGVLR